MNNKIYSLENFGVKKHDLTLDNGLNVIFIEKPFAPIYAKLMIRAGSVFNVGDSGLAHFTEHVIVSGSKKYPTKEAFASITSSVGAYANANTGRTELCLECEVAVSGHMNAMGEYFSEAMSGLYITPQSLKKEKGVIISEIYENISKPDYLSGRFMANLWGNGTSWGNSNLGTIDSVQAIKKSDVEGFFEKYCSVENMLLVVAGGCTTEDIISTFSKINFVKGEKVFLPDSPKPLPKKQRVFFEQNIEKANVGVFFQMPKIGTEDSVLLSLLLKYFHDGLTSKFYKKLRNERGLVYGVYSPAPEMGFLRYGGTFTSVKPENVDFVIDAILECYDEVLSEGVLQKDIDSKIMTMWYSQIRELERSYDWICRFDDLYPETDLLKIGDFPNIFNWMQNIKEEKAFQVLQKYISTKNYHLVIHGKESSKKYF